MVKLPPQPQVLFRIEDKNEGRLCVGQLIYEGGIPYAIPNDPIPGHPRIKLTEENLQQGDARTLGLEWWFHAGIVLLPQR